MNAALHLRIAGMLLLLLAMLHVFLPKRLGWKEDMAKVTLLNRQIFYVHCFFIVLFVAMTGVLSLFFADALLEPSTLARVVLIGLITFWSARLFTQWFVYDSSIWRGNRERTIVHIVFTTLWAYLVFTYSLALARVCST